jgi:hypothetical protein
MLPDRLPKTANDVRTEPVLFTIVKNKVLVCWSVPVHVVHWSAPSTKAVTTSKSLDVQRSALGQFRVTVCANVFRDNKIPVITNSKKCSQLVVLRLTKKVEVEADVPVQNAA